MKLSDKIAHVGIVLALAMMAGWAMYLTITSPVHSAATWTLGTVWSLLVLFTAFLVGRITWQRWRDGW